MEETIIQPNVTSTIAGDDGEAMAKSLERQDFIANEGLDEPRDAGWYVAVVRVNCEERIALSIQKAVNFHKIWFDYWIPKIKVVYIDKRSHKRRIKEKLFLSTFIFCHISAKRVNDVRFRSDVYKMLTLPGQREIYRIPDQELINYRHFVENDEEPVTSAPVPLKKGIKVRVIYGKLKGVEAYVQNFTGKRAVIGNELKYISGATISINRDFLEVVEEKHSKTQ